MNIFYADATNIDKISLLDRGLQYGDGCFTTLSVIQRYPLFWTYHQARLAIACQRLNITPPDFNLLKHQVITVAEKKDIIIKIIITRGIGLRGYRPSQSSIPNVLLYISPYKFNHDNFYRGVKACWCRTPISINTRLAGIKHLNRLEQVLARNEWQDNNVFEGIMLDYHKHVIAGTMSNLFWVKDNIVYTPSVAKAGIAGVMRRCVFNWIKQLGLRYKVVLTDKKAVINADEVFMTNSLIGIYPIVSLPEKDYNIDSTTYNLQQIYLQALPCGF